ncbi:MAG: matrixin family metalloprotease [Phycisphaerales bacterium]|nr:matrixin family metalloprotease [Phycisphaerales bacterium]
MRSAITIMTVLFGAALATGTSIGDGERLLARVAAGGVGCQTATDTAIPEGLRAPADGAPGWLDYRRATRPAIGLDDAEPSHAACFDPDNPPSWEIQQAVNNMVRGALADRFVLNSTWPGADNSPIALTWSFVPDGTSIPGSASVGEPTAASVLFSTMGSRFGEANRAVWIAQFQACFDRWSQLAGVTFTFVSNNGNDWDDGAAFPSSPGALTPGATRGDIRISCHAIDGGGGILAYNYYPAGGDMVLDSAETWNFGAPGYTRLRNIVSHELGHALGLSHVCPTNRTKLMEPIIVTTFDGPQHDDIRGAQYNYGDKYEPNNSRPVAASIGSLSSAGQSLTPSTPPAPAIADGSLTGISLDGDEDWYAFTVTTPLVGTISVAPVGSSYADYVQDSSCNNTTPNATSQSVADLRIEFVNASGATIASANATGFGGTEAFNNVLLSPPGTLYVRVRENNLPTETQLYTLTISAISAPSVTATDGAFTNKVNVTWSAIAGSMGYRVYRGTSSNRTLATLVHSAIASSTSFDDFSVGLGVTYFYWVEADTNGTGLWRAAGGPDTGFISSINAPANDFCANAAIVAMGSIVNGTLASASNDGSATCGSSTTNPDVWYTITAPCAGTLVLSTCGTSDTGGTDLGIDSVLSIWSGCPAAGGSQLACNDNAFNAECDGSDNGLPRDAALSRVLSAGESVRVRVSKAASGAVGPFTLRVDFVIAGDVCDSPVSVSPGQTNNFCTTGASTDGAAEPGCFASGGTQIGSDLWFRYAPVSTGPFTVRTCGSAFDTRLAVYGACGGGAVACNDNDEACGVGSLQSSLRAMGAAGATYLVRVGGTGAASGSGQLRVYCAPDVNLSGDSSLQDVFDFLGLYFAGDPTADFNDSGDQSVQDLFDFLVAWFGGC